MDKLKLVEILDDIQQNGNDFRDVEIYGMRIPDTVSNEEVADHLLANGVTVQKWIPVTERLPESLDFVVALTTGGDRIIAKLDRYGWLRYGGYETERLRPVTHWMPLPEPPKEV